MTKVISSFTSPLAVADLPAPSVLISAQTDALVLGSTITLGANSSLIGWYFFTGPSLSNYSPLWFAGSGPDTQWYYGDGGNANKLTVILAGTRVLISTTNLPATDSGWHLIATTDDGVALRSYIDGVDAGNSVGAYTSLNGMGITKLTQGVNANNYFGYISMCAVFDRALSAAEVLAVYNAGRAYPWTGSLAPFNSGLQVAWHLYEGHGDVVHAFAGANNPLTLTRGSTGENGTAMWRMGPS